MLFLRDHVDDSFGKEVPTGSCGHGAEPWEDEFAQVLEECLPLLGFHGGGDGYSCSEDLEAEVSQCGEVDVFSVEDVHRAIDQIHDVFPQSWRKIVVSGEDFKNFLEGYSNAVKLLVGQRGGQERVDFLGISSSSQGKQGEGRNSGGVKRVPAPRVDKRVSCLMENFRAAFFQSRMSEKGPCLDIKLNAAIKHIPVVFAFIGHFSQPLFSCVSRAVHFFKKDS